MKRSPKAPRRKTRTERHWDCLYAVFGLQRAGQRATRTSVANKLDLRPSTHIHYLLTDLVECGILIEVPFTHWNGKLSHSYTVNFDNLPTEVADALAAKFGAAP